MRRLINHKKFHYLLYRALNNNNQNVLKWINDNEFIIDPYNVEDFKKIGFRHANIASFYKQLNNYNFTINSDNKYRVSHKYFKRYQPELLEKLEKSCIIRSRKYLKNKQNNIQAKIAAQNASTIAIRAAATAVLAYNNIISDCNKSIYNYNKSNYLSFHKIFKLYEIQDYSVVPIFDDYINDYKKNIISDWEHIEHLFD